VPETDARFLMQISKSHSCVFSRLYTCLHYYFQRTYGFWFSPSFAPSFACLDANHQ